MGFLKSTPNSEHEPSLFNIITKIFYSKLTLKPKNHTQATTLLLPRNPHFVLLHTLYYLRASCRHHTSCCHRAPRRAGAAGIQFPNELGIPASTQFPSEIEFGMGFLKPKVAWGSSQEVGFGLAKLASPQRVVIPTEMWYLPLNLL